LFPSAWVTGTPKKNVAVRVCWFPVFGVWLGLGPRGVRPTFSGGGVCVCVCVCRLGGLHTGYFCPCGSLCLSVYSPRCVFVASEAGVDGWCAVAALAVVPLGAPIVVAVVVMRACECACVRVCVRASVRAGGRACLCSCGRRRLCCCC